MSVYTVLQYSPNSSKASNSPRRKFQPSPARKCLTGLTMILPKKQISSTKAGSPVKKSHTSSFTETGSAAAKGRDEPGEPYLEHEFNLLLKEPNSDFIRSVATSNRITLSSSLIKNGRYIGPPKDGFAELTSLFPTTYAVEVRPPFLLFRVRTIPPKPWPLSVVGLPPRFTTDEFKAGWDIGKAGRGPKLLSQYNLQRKDEFSDTVLWDVINSLVEHKFEFVDIRWYGAFWVVTLPSKEINSQKMPSFLAGQGCYYRFSESEAGLPVALRGKIPAGIKYDYTAYGYEEDSILRPGIMVSSSATTSTVDGKEVNNYKSTTTGIMIVNQDGELFITMAAHGFEENGLVWHPTPHQGKIIGTIIVSIPDTDIAIVKLKKDLRYTNHTFGTAENPSGNEIAGISPKNYPPHTFVGDIISMDNPYSGFCEGQVIALGAKIADSGTRYIAHTWLILQNEEEVMDGSYGSAILDEENKVVGFFRDMSNDGTDGFAVSATELKEGGYEICGGVQTW